MFVKKIILKNYPKKNYNRKINFALKNFLFIIGAIYKLRRVWIVSSSLEMGVFLSSPWERLKIQLPL